MNKKRLILIIALVLLAVGTVAVFAGQMRCGPCGGTGFILCSSCRGTGYNQVGSNTKAVCRTCGGNGQVICRICNGTGWR